MKKYFLVLIVLLGFFVRIVGLANHPAGFTADEASFGYDAYSILATGKDQWGNTLPLVFKSFGDDKLPVYTYLAVPSVAVFGLNEFSVRLPNAILGTLAIVVVYLLVEELSERKDIALLSAFLIAVSPWHIMLSRGAFEANLTTFFLPLAVLLFLKSFRTAHNEKYLMLSFAIFVVEVFTYHTARVLAPLVFLFLIFSYRDNLKNQFKTAIAFAFVLCAISFAGLIFGGSRLTTSLITNINYSDDRYRAELSGEPSVLSKFFYNKPYYIVRQFSNSYLSYFSPQFLFSNGAGEGTYGMVPGIGTTYVAEVVLLVGSVLFIVTEGYKRKAIQLLLFWIFISPIPAALTKGPGYAGNRAAFTMPALEIILAFGGIYLFELIYHKANHNSQKMLFKVCLWIYVLVSLVNMVYVAEEYWVGQAVNQASAMSYGVAQVVGDIKSEKNIVVSRLISEPQIFVAFYNKIDPRLYQKASRNWNLVNGWVDQQGNYSLGNYTFRDINYNSDKNVPGLTLVSEPKDFPPDIKPDIQINYPDFVPAYYIVKTK